jgi:hypothetical protein
MSGLRESAHDAKKKQSERTPAMAATTPCIGQFSRSSVSDIASTISTAAMRSASYCSSLSKPSGSGLRGISPRRRIRHQLLASVERSRNDESEKVPGCKRKYYWAKEKQGGHLTKGEKDKAVLTPPLTAVV